MASRSGLFRVSVIFFFAVSILSQESNAARETATKTLNQVSAHDKLLRKSNSRKTASDFTFTDDEDKLMSNDDPFASSGDGPEPEQAPESSNASPESPESSPEFSESSPEPSEASPESSESSPEPSEASPESSESSPEPSEASPESSESSPEFSESSPEPSEASPESSEPSPESSEASPESLEGSHKPSPEPVPEITEVSEIEHTSPPREPQTAPTDISEETSSWNPFEPETATDDWNSYWSEHPSNETLHEDTLPDDYFPIDSCGKQQYCRYGYRGPCHRNEMFTTSLFDDFSLFHRKPTCSSNSNWDTCLSSFGHHYSVVNRPPGFCKVRFPSRPCFGYPSSYRYCTRTKLCYPSKIQTTTLMTTEKRLNFRGPCPADQIFTAVDHRYGQCACRRPNHVYCKRTHRCYPAYTAASCSKGEWLVPSRHGGVCRKCPCPSMADGRHIFWSGRGRHYGRPGCYKSYTQGPCRPGMYFRIDDFTTGSWRCVPRHQDGRMGLYSLIRDWKLLNDDMLQIGPLVSNDFLDDPFENPWF